MNNGEIQMKTRFIRSSKRKWNLLKLLWLLACCLFACVWEWKYELLHIDMFGWLYFSYTILCKRWRLFLETPTRFSAAKLCNQELSSQRWSMSCHTWIANDIRVLAEVLHVQKVNRTLGSYLFDNNLFNEMSWVVVNNILKPLICLLYIVINSRLQWSGTVKSSACNSK